MTRADSVHSTPPTSTSAEAVDLLYRPTDISPEELFQAIGRLRQDAQDEIERLLSFLDDLDGDTDLEPSLTGYSPGMDDREGGECEDEGADCADDREEDIVDKEDGGDSEPSQGWNDEEAARGRYPSQMGVQS
jgi:hypothetical protein